MTDFLNQRIPIILIKLVDEMNNVDSLAFEVAKVKYPFLNDKTQSKKLQVLKYMSEKIVGLNTSLVENAYKASSLYYDLG